MTIDEQIAVLQAVKAGKPIQIKTIRDGKWLDRVSGPACNFAAYEYRIKPEKAELWVLVNASGEILRTQTSKTAAQQANTEFHRGTLRIAHLVEAEE